MFTPADTSKLACTFGMRNPVPPISPITNHFNNVFMTNLFVAWKVSKLKQSQRVTGACATQKCRLIATSYQNRRGNRCLHSRAICNVPTTVHCNLQGSLLNHSCRPMRANHSGHAWLGSLRIRMVEYRQGIL